jgi:hypothetical protein
LLDFFLVLLESPFLLVLESLSLEWALVESLSDESLSLESVSSPSLPDEPVLLLALDERDRFEPDSLSDESLSLLPRLSLSPAESSESSSALVECDDELVPRP